MRARVVNEIESFTRGGNPYAKLGIGKKKALINWLKRMNIEPGTVVDDELNVSMRRSLHGTDFRDRENNIIVFPYMKSLQVSGYIDLEHCNILAIPNNITTFGFLDLRFTGITKLPANLTVGGTLFLNDKITELPKDINIKTLDLADSPIQKKDIGHLNIEKITNEGLIPT